MGHPSRTNDRNLESKSHQNFGSYESKKVTQRLEPSLGGLFTARLKPSPRAGTLSFNLFSVQVPTCREI